METAVIEVMSDTNGKNEAGRNNSENTLYKDSGDDACSKCRSASTLLRKRRQLNPLMCTVAGSPYRASSTYGVRFNSSAKANMADYSQKIMSAKVLRVKQLQNDLRDAQFQLNELATENKLLKSLQKRQDLALKKYEDQKAALPQLIHSHNEEVRVLRAKVKQLKAQGREKDHRIKELEADLQSLRDQHYHLLKLSKDQQLGEREQLSRQVEDLKEIIQDQDAKIQILNRKILLESKNFKHQLATEMTRHKGTGRALKEALGKISHLEMLVASKEKYIATRLPKRLVQNKVKSSASMLSLTDSSRFPVLHSGIKTETESNSQLEDGVSGAYMISSVNNSHGSRDTSRIISETKISLDGYNARRDRLANKRKSMLERIQPEPEFHKINNLPTSSAPTLSSSSSSSSLQNDQENLDEEMNKYSHKFESLCDSNSSENTLTSRRQSSDNGRQKLVDHMNHETENSETTTDESLKENRNGRLSPKTSEFESSAGNNLIEEPKISVDRALTSETSDSLKSAAGGKRNSSRRRSLLETKRNSLEDDGNFTSTQKLLSRRGSLNVRKSSDSDYVVSESNRVSLNMSAENNLNTDVTSARKHLSEPDSAIEGKSIYSKNKTQNKHSSEDDDVKSDDESQHESDLSTRDFSESCDGDGNNNNKSVLAETCKHLDEISESYKKIQHSLETERKKVEHKIKVVDDESASLENKHYQKEKLLAALKAIDEGKDPTEFKRRSESTSVLHDVMNNPSSGKNVSLPFVGPIRIVDRQVQSEERETDTNRVKSKLELLQEIFGEHRLDHKT